jgi:hypothetical protein
MNKPAAILMALIAVAVLAEGCGGGKGNFRSRIPDCEEVSANARPGVDCINRPNN